MFKRKAKKLRVSGGGSSLGEAARFAFCAFLVLIGGFISIWPHIRILKLDYERGELRKRYEGLLQQNRLMSLEVANLRSLEKIEEAAVHKFNMAVPDDAHVIVVRTRARDAATKKEES